MWSVNQKTCLSTITIGRLFHWNHDHCHKTCVCQIMFTFVSPQWSPSKKLGPPLGNFEVAKPDFLKNQMAVKEPKPRAAKKESETRNVSYAEGSKARKKPEKKQQSIWRTFTKTGIPVFLKVNLYVFLGSCRMDPEKKCSSELLVDSWDGRPWPGCKETCLTCRAIHFCKSYHLVLFHIICTRKLLWWLFMTGHLENHCLIQSLANSKPQQAHLRCQISACFLTNNTPHFGTVHKMSIQNDHEMFSKPKTQTVRFFPRRWTLMAKKFSSAASVVCPWAKPPIDPKRRRPERPEPVGAGSPELENVGNMRISLDLKTKKCHETWGLKIFRFLKWFVSNCFHVFVRVMMEIIVFSCLELLVLSHLTCALQLASSGPCFQLAPKPHLLGLLRKGWRTGQMRSLLLMLVVLWLLL